MLCLCINLLSFLVWRPELSLGAGAFYKQSCVVNFMSWWLITRLVTVKQYTLYSTDGGLQIELEVKAGDWIKTMKTKHRLRVWYSGCLCCRTERKLSIRPCLDLQLLTREPAMNEYIKSCGPEVCSVWWYTFSRMSHSLSRQLEQVYQSELELESEQEQGRGDARDGMGTCCCSCLPLGQGTDSSDLDTEVVAELELASLEKEERQIETR